MKKIDTILAEYRQADLDLQLAMFLRYRDLRPEFQQIDSEQERAENESDLASQLPVAPKPRTNFSLVQRILEWCSLGTR